MWRGAFASVETLRIAQVAGTLSATKGWDRPPFFKLYLYNLHSTNRSPGALCAWHPAACQWEDVVQAARAGGWEKMPDAQLHFGSVAWDASCMCAAGAPHLQPSPASAIVTDSLYRDWHRNLMQQVGSLAEQMLGTRIQCIDAPLQLLRHAISSQLHHSQTLS